MGHLTISHKNISGLEILLQYSKGMESITTKDHKGTTVLELATSLDNQQAIDILTPYFNKIYDIPHSTETSNTVLSSLDLFPITSGENNNGINQASEALDTTFNSSYQPVESLGLLSIYHNDLSNEQQ